MTLTDTQVVDALKEATDGALSEDTYHLMYAVVRQQLEQYHAEIVEAALLDAHRAMNYSNKRRQFSYAHGAADAFRTAANIAKETILNV